MPDQREIDAALAFLGNPEIDPQETGVPADVRACQMETYAETMRKVWSYLSRHPGASLTIWVKIKKDGWSVSIKCRPREDGKIRVYCRTDTGGECIRIPKEYVPEWARALDASFSAEAHGTLNDEPLGFYKVPSLFKMWRDGTPFPPGLRLHLSVFGLQSLFTGSEQNGGKYDDETRERILSMIVPNGSDGMLAPIEPTKYSVRFCAGKGTLLFTKADTQEVVADDPDHFLEYLRKLAKGHEGLVMNFTKKLFRHTDGRAWISERMHEKTKRRQLSMIKIRDPYRVQVALTLAQVAKKKDGDYSRQFMLWTHRGDRLEYAGTPSDVMIYHLDQIDQRRFHLKPFMAVDGEEALRKLYKAGLDLSFLRDKERCIVCDISAASVTVERGCVTGVKAKTRIVSDPDPSRMEDTLVVAGRVEYWNRMKKACAEFDRQFRSLKRKREKNNGDRPVSPFGERELPILPPPPPMDAMDELAAAFVRNREMWARERPEEEKEPEEYYQFKDSLPLSPALHACATEEEEPAGEASPAEEEEEPAGEASPAEEEEPADPDFAQTLPYQEPADQPKPKEEEAATQVYEPRPPSELELIEASEKAAWDAYAKELNKPLPKQEVWYYLNGIRMEYTGSFPVVIDPADGQPKHGDSERTRWPKEVYLPLELVAGSGVVRHTRVFVGKPPPLLGDQFYPGRQPFNPKIFFVEFYPRTDDTLEHKIRFFGGRVVYEKGPDVDVVIVGNFTHDRYQMEFFKDRERGPYDPAMPNAITATPSMVQLLLRMPRNR